MNSFDRWTFNKRAAEKAAREVDTDPFVAAVIDREVAEDEFFACRYELDVLADESADRAAGKLQDLMISARLRALVEADAAGIVNLFDKVADEDVDARAAAIAAFAGSVR